MVGTNRCWLDLSTQRSPGLIAPARAAAPALVGQALNFAAMLLPIFLGRAGAIVLLLGVMAVSVALGSLSQANLVSNLLTAADHSRGRIAAYAAMTTFVVCGALAVVALLLGLFGKHGIALAGMHASMMVAAQTVYQTHATVLLHEQKTGAFGRVRLGYGILNVVLTVASCVFLTSNFALVYATSVTLLGAGLLARREATFKPWVRGERCAEGYGRYLRQNSRGIVAATIQDCSFQVHNFAAQGAGQYSSLWASSLRVSGGVGTVMQQVVAPTFTATISAAIRGKAHARYRSAAIGALLAGLAGGIVAAFGLAATLWISATSLLAHISTSAISLWLLASIFSIANLSVSCIVRVPLMLHHQQFLLLWALARTAANLLLLFQLGGIQLLLALTLSELTFNAVFVIRVLSARVRN